MINLVVSLVAGLVVAVAIKLAGFPLLAGVIPGTVVMLAIFIVMGRRTFTQLQTIMQQVQAELSSMTANQKEQKVKVEKAIKLLETALPLGKWQFLVEGQIWAEIGTLKFLFKDHPGASEAFAKATPRHFMAQAMKASMAFQKKDMATTEACFEEAVKHGKKESLMWAAYAWCLVQNKEGDKAMRVLARGVEANPSDDKLKKALTDLQNDKRLKMKAWEPMWWQLGFEAPPLQQPQFMVGGGRRRFMRR
jgi:predicted Zn-dependent protease